MDINKLLETLRELSQLANDDSVLKRTRQLAAEEMAEHFANLDEWLSKGGFKPEAWARAR